jgi:glycosyltransferase involved in cell wall biosynthesis
MGEMKQLTIDVRMYRNSGIGRYLQTLMPDLIPRLDASRIRILCNPDNLKDEGWTNDPRIEIREFRAPIFSVAEQLAVAQKTYSDADLLWVPQYNIPLLYRGKLLVTLHDLCQLAHPETLGNEVQRWYAKRLLSAVAARADAILCVSEFTAGEARRYLGVSPGRLTVAHPPISNPWDMPESTHTKEGEGRYLLTVGNLKSHKNFKTLIAAFDLIRDRIPHDLIVVGQRGGFMNSDPDLGSLASLQNGRVRFTGHVSDSELRRYYRGADAFVLPSIYEGFGSPVVEAMALGCPVACSNIASLPEVAGDAALFFDPFSVADIGRVIMKVINDPGLREKMVESGLRRAQMFRGDMCARTTAEVINRLMGRTQPDDGGWKGPDA